jgi:triphosphoribosyl-dephospho-CoA synthetase
MDEGCGAAISKPSLLVQVRVDAQIAALREYEQTKPGRTIPPKATDRILIATWNIANLGVQERRDKDYRSSRRS